MKRKGKYQYIYHNYKTVTETVWYNKVSFSKIIILNNNNTQTLTLKGIVQ